MSKDAFIAGYQDAVAGTVYDPTPCQVEEAYPDYARGDVDAYINGVDDAMRADIFRLRLCYCVHPDAEWCDCDWCRFARSLHAKAAIALAERQAP